MEKKLLNNPTEPIGIKPGKKISELTDEMMKTGFQGRKLGESVEVWSEMLKEEKITIWLGLAGAMVPAGMRRVISYLIENRMIDALVSTGANLYHDTVEALGYTHYIGSAQCNDVVLREQKVDRIHDVFADEDQFHSVDYRLEKDFCDLLKDDCRYSSREILYILGKWLDENGKNKDSILVSAYKNNVPVFSPALSDSSIGFSIMFSNRKYNHRILLDALKDVDETSKITEKSEKTGVIYIGGGTPKNFIQQTSVIADYTLGRDKSHSYAIQISADMPAWGGLSGCTFEEAQSWGKVSANARKVHCYADATIALPIIVNSLSEKVTQKRKGTTFVWKDDDLELTY
jgi:deoxyhypusine synthase